MSPDGQNRPDSEDNRPNPFAEDPAAGPISDNPFASPEAGGFNTDVTGHYESMAPDRGAGLMAMAVAGVAISIMGAIPLFCCYPVNLLALAFAVPAWLLAKSDLRGMDLGAIDSSNRRQTRTAYLLGLTGTLLAILPVVVVVVMLFAGVGTDAMIEFREELGF